MIEQSLGVNSRVTRHRPRSIKKLVDLGKSDTKFTTTFTAVPAASPQLICDVPVVIADY